MIAELDPWAATPESLEALAAGLAGGRPGGWIRPAGFPAVILKQWNGITEGYDCGCRPEHIAAELNLLNEQTRQIRGGRGDARLRAVAFFQLKLLRIHPLRDCNGRAARVHAALQLEREYGFEFASTLHAIESDDTDFRAVFRMNDSEAQFELLVDFLARTFGLGQAAEAGRLPASLEPRFPDRSAAMADKIRALVPNAAELAGAGWGPGLPADAWAHRRQDLS